jgi:hypothetical protein
MEDEMDGKVVYIYGGGDSYTSGGKPYKKENTWKKELGAYKINKLGSFGLDSSGKGQGPEARSYENGNRISDFKECRKLLH